MSAALAPTLGNFSLTQHALTRMATRSISRTAIEAAVAFGRCVSTRGAQIFAIGRKEVERYRRDGIDLGRFEGTQVVVSANGSVMTAYRNRNFKGLRRRRPRR